MSFLNLNNMISLKWILQPSFNNVCILQNDVIEDFLQRDEGYIIIKQQNNQSKTSEGGRAKRDKISSALAI